MDHFYVHILDQVAAEGWEVAMDEGFRDERHPSEHLFDI